MRRIALAVVLIPCLVLAPLAVLAQPAEKAVRIAVLSPGPGPVSSGSALEAFRQRLQDLGYVDGRNLTIEWRFMAGNVARLPEVARESPWADDSALNPGPSRRDHPVSDD